MIIRSLLPLCLGILCTTGSCTGWRVREKTLTTPTHPPAPVPVVGGAIWDDLAHWRRLDSTHFSLVTDNQPANAERILRDFEEYFAALVTVSFPGVAPGADKIPVVALTDTQELRRYLSGWSTGVFMSRPPHQPVIVLGPSEHGFDDAVVRHELVHYVMSLTHARPLPRCLEEGIATYFQTMAYDRDRHRLLVGRADLGPVQLLKAHGPSVPIAELMGKRAQHLADADSDRFYSTCWLLVHFLLREAPGVLPSMQGAVAAGSAPDIVWQQATPPELRATMDTRLATYLRDKRYEVGVRMPWEAPPVVTKPVPLTAADLLAMRALLHLTGSDQQPERKDEHRREARRRAEAALALDPQNQLASQVLAVFFKDKASR